MHLLYEYETTNDKNLITAIQNNPKLQKYFSINWEGVKPKNYCGLLHVGGEDYYILPKISNKDEEANLNIFTYMLMVAYDIKLENENFASQDNHQHKILEIFIHLFTKTLSLELQRGLYKQYITYQENLQVLRGKYLINENLKYNFTNQKIYCEFDEFSPDNALNKFFLYAIKIFFRHAKDKKGLKQCELMLDEVAYKHLDINKLEMHFDRLNRRFEKSFEIAIMILKRYIPLFSKDKQSFAFLFNMNELFENFVGKMIPDAKLQNQRNFGNLALKPDIIIDNLIIDIKYKKVSNREDLSTADKYQMYVYGKNYEIQKTMLLYPKHVDDVDENLVLGKDEECINLAMKSLDLEFDGGFEGFVVEIKKRIKEIVDGY